MESIVDKLIAALVGGLIVWLISKYYHRSRLYCAPSRLYEYSTLADGSSTVQLSIANRGRKAEENVEVQLSTDYEYHVIASSQNGITVPNDKIVRLPVLLPKSEVSLIVTAEGRPRFSKEGIKSISSKSARGTVGATLAEAEAASPGAAAIAISFLFGIGVLGYFVGSTIGEDAWRWGKEKLLARNVQPFSEGCITDSISSGAKASSEGVLSHDELERFAANSVRVKRVSNIGDTLYVDFEINNPVDIRSEYNVSMKSVVSDSSTSSSLFRDTSVYGITTVKKGEVKSYQFRDYFPVGTDSKLFWLEVRLEVAGYWVEVERAYSFGEDAAASCDSTGA